jgi:hypothetical protein
MVSSCKGRQKVKDFAQQCYVYWQLAQLSEPRHEDYEQLRRVASQTGSCVNQCIERERFANVLSGAKECSTATRWRSLARPALVNWRSP